MGTNIEKLAKEKKNTKNKCKEGTSKTNSQKERGAKNKCKETTDKAYKKGAERGKKAATYAPALPMMPNWNKGPTGKAASDILGGPKKQFVARIINAQKSITVAQEKPQKREQGEKVAKEKQTKSLQQKLRTSMTELAA